jgi:hypothetical protein
LYDITHLFSGPLNYASLTSTSDDDGAWEIVSSGVVVNGRTSPVLDTNITMIIDSGTTNVVFGLNMTNAIYSLISSDIQPFTPIPGAYGIACSKVPNLPAKIDLKFTSQENEEFTLTIPSSELNVGPFESDPDTCQTLINADDRFGVVIGGR